MLLTTLITKAAIQVGVPAQLLIAICDVESNLRTYRVTHLDGHYVSHGACQVQLPTALYMDKVYRHRIAATQARLEDPYINAFYAAKYLKYQYKRYGQWNQAVTAYNKGFSTSGNSVYWKKVKRALKEAEHEATNR